MKNLSELNKYFIKYKKKLIAGFFFIILSNLLQTYIPLVVKEGVDFIKNAKNTTELLHYALWIAGLSLFSGIFRFLIRQTIIVVSREIEYDILDNFWSHTQKLAYRFFKNTPAGQIMALATNDVGAVRTYLGPAVMYSLDTITKLIMILVVLFSINTKLTILMLLPFPFASFMVYILAKKIHKRYSQIQEKFENLTSRAQESFSGIRVIKSYVREDYERNEFNEMSKEYMQKNISLIKIQSLFIPVLYFLIGLTLVIVIWFGGTMVADKILTTGEFLAFLAYLTMLTWPMIAFGWVANIIQQADASMGRLKKLFDEKYEIKDNEGTDYSIKTIDGKVEFRNVGFSYSDNGIKVLKDINIVINPGETLAIIGHTGSGKSSLINLIPRLFDATTGNIIIDNKEIKTIPLEVLRKNIGFVPQEAFLFSESIHNNINYGDSTISPDYFNLVTNISNINKDVEEFKEQYETVIGEKGITLSGGQKQRTSLARALAVNPKILIMDDSFSAVDTHTEEQILRRLKEFMENRTSIIISHRISTVKDADKIIVLKDGMIAEQGTHNQLVEQNGIYADLHYKQLLEQEIEELN